MTTYRDHAYNIARSYPGGAAALALRMGKNATSLQHELLGTGTAKLGLDDAVALSALAGDLRILQAWAGDAGQMLVPLPGLPDGPVSDCLLLLGNTAKEFSELVAESAKDLADGKINDNELAGIEREASEMFAAVHAFLRAAREANLQGKTAHLRPAR